MPHPLSARTLPRIDFNERSIERPAPSQAHANLAGRWWWWVEHALRRAQPIRVPVAFGEAKQPAEFNGFVVQPLPGVYRVEIIGPAITPGLPSTGVPIATVFTFAPAFDRGGALAALWTKVFEQYGAAYRTIYPDEDCYLVIRHNHLAQAGGPVGESLIRRVCDGAGHGAHLHSRDVPPANELRQCYTTGLSPEELELSGLFR